MGSLLLTRICKDRRTNGVFLYGIFDYANLVRFDCRLFLYFLVAVAVWLLNKVQPNLFSADPTYPAIAVFTICEAVVGWEKQRKWSILLIVGAVISLAFFLPERML